MGRSAATRLAPHSLGVRVTNNHMTNFLCILQAALLFALSASFSYAGDSFNQELYSEVEITKQINPPQKPESVLSESDKGILLNAKRTLVQFLKSFSSATSNPRSYLSSSLAKEYKDRFDLYRKEFNSEAILSIKIFDYVLKREKNEVVFYVFLKDTNEGTDRITQSSFALKLLGNKWQISRFSQNIKDSDVETN